MTIKEGTATVDFNEKLLSYEEPEAERSIISSIVYTLTEFKTISNVKILINGYSREKLRYDTDISGLLDRSNVMVNTSGVNRKQDRYKLDIYVLRNANDKFSYILPVSVELDDMPEESVPERIVELFGSDFDGDGFYSEVPPEASLIDSKVSGDLLVLNFNSHIRDYGGTASENAIINQILFSMKQVNGVNKEKILIDGEDSLLPEGTDLSAEMKLPAVINDIID
jgi:germination protein M